MRQNIETMHIVMDKVALDFLMNLRHIVKANKLTMKSLSLRLGKKAPWLSDIATQHRNAPRLGDFVKLAEFLKYDISESINTRFYRNPEKFTQNLRRRIKRTGKNAEFFVDFASSRLKAVEFIKARKTPLSLEVMHELEQVVNMLEATQKL